jgi:DNA-binding MarR family transcriptional regulator
VSGEKRRGAGGSRVSRRIPLTADARSLLVDGSDGRLRQLVYDLFIVSVRMQQLRNALAHQMGVTGPQYSILMAVGELQGDTGVTVGAVAQRMHVTGAHATIEVGKLVKRGLLSKTTNPNDGRSVLLRLTPRGLAQIDAVAPMLRATNDLFFGALDRKKFLAAGVIAEHLVAGSERALRWWETHVGGDRVEAGPDRAWARNGRQAAQHFSRTADAASVAAGGRRSRRQFRPSRQVRQPSLHDEGAARGII